MLMRATQPRSARLPESYDHMLKSSLGRWLDHWKVDGVRPVWQHGLANKLTKIRLAIIALSPLYYWLVVSGHHWIATMVTVGVLVLFATDAVDGFVARYTDDVTDQGRMLDPVIDRLATIAITLAWIAASGRTLPSLYYLIVLVWEIRLAVEIILWAVAVYWELSGLKPSAKKAGKYRFHVDVVIVVLGCIMADWGLNPVGWGVVVLTIVTIPLTLITFGAQLTSADT